MNFRNYIRDHLFFYPIALGVVIVSVISFYRFIVKNDYLVYYEGACDPYTKLCFKSCDDEGCTYYVKMQKYAPDIYAECGKDVTDCELANTCAPNDRQCSMTYCDAGTEDCAMLARVQEAASSSDDIPKETQ